MLISGSAERAALADYGSAHAAPTTPARKSHFANRIEGSGRQARAKASRLRWMEAKGGHMYWFFVVVVAGVGFGWMMVRRRRKADEKTA